MTTNEYDGYVYEAQSSCEAVVKTQVDGSKWNDEGWSFSAVLRFTAHDNKDHSKMLRDSGGGFGAEPYATSFPFGIMVLPNSTTAQFAKPATKNTTASTLMREEFSFPLNQDSMEISFQLSELGRTGIQCDWYPKTEEVGVAAYEADELPSLKPKKKQVARLKGSLTVTLLKLEKAETGDSDDLVKQFSSLGMSEQDFASPSNTAPSAD